MPTYDLRHIPTGEVEEHFVSIRTMTEMTESCDYEIVHRKTGGLIPENGDMFSKVSDGWKDHLRGIKKGSGRNSNIKY